MGREKIDQQFLQLHACRLCPRECGADRYTDRLGYCRSGTGFNIGSICLHRGEEPLISGDKGICNVFFTRCNMQCSFCQNYAISRNSGPIHEEELELEEVIARIEELLGVGARSVGFVSPSHCIPQMLAIIEELNERGLTPTTVMNTNAYDKVDILRMLEGAIDVYLPDLKYMDTQLAATYSDTPDYPQFATQALAEMFSQKGVNIVLDKNGSIVSGLIVRHLVLPGQVRNSIDCLRFIARELSNDVHISLMSQYQPTPAVARHHSLGRALHKSEYERVLREMDRLGFSNGYVQRLGSSASWLPDFDSPTPFGSHSD